MKTFVIVLLFVGLIILAILTGSVFLKSEPTETNTAYKASTADCPNLVLIYTDDLDCESVFFDWEQSRDDPNTNVQFPNIKQLAYEGMSFTNLHATTPVCGPSRACLFSGKYAHRNNVRVNDPTSKFALGFSGGYDEFDQTNEIGHWMKTAGYHTAFVGKYMHHQFVPGPTKENRTWKEMSPAGWDDFYAYLGARYFNVPWTDCKTNDLSHTGETYRTDAEADHCIEIIRQHAKSPGDQPLFLCWAPLAAHEALKAGPMVADRHLDLEVEPRPPQLDICRNLNAEGLPPQMQNLKPYSKSEEENLIEFWQNRLRSIKAIDERIADVRMALEETGQLENTIFIFTSDHGYELGAHRHHGKRFPYDRITKVPFIVCGKGVKAGTTCDELLAIIDVAPTLIKLAGGNVPKNIDGRTFDNLFDNPAGNLIPPRKAIMIENWESEKSRGIVIDAFYCAMRTHKHIYTEWGNGAREYYDIEADPEQINNLFDSLDAPKKKQLWEQIRELRTEEFDPFVTDAVEIATFPLDESGTIEISGFAEDDRGIGKLELEIFEKTSSQYWNGDDWVSEKSTVLAEVSSPKGMLTSWQYRFSPIDKSTKLKDIDLKVSIKVFDLQGNSTEKKISSHQLLIQSVASPARLNELRIAGAQHGVSTQKPIDS
ncbi:sulfatase-like hydrolase/transferase [Mariniblastus sp.]|nr:sulfatase-like hydrolase/transferase [Mariniblastus sp.]